MNIKVAAFTVSEKSINIVLTNSPDVGDLYYIFTHLVAFLSIASVNFVIIYMKKHVVTRKISITQYYKLTRIISSSDKEGNHKSLL